MTTISILMMRHLRLFWRDKVTVIVAMLAPIIMFTLFVVFIRKQQAGLVQEVMPKTSSVDAYGLCDAWLFASVVALTSFTASLGMLYAFVDDRATGRFSDYLVAPVKRWELAISYVLSTVIVSFVISSLLMLAGQVWAIHYDQQLMTGTLLLRALGAVLLACIVYSALNSLVVTFIASQGGFGGYAIVVGTAFGFLAFCYVPPQALSTTINTVLGTMPFAQTASLIRYPIMLPAIDQLLVPYTPDLQDQIREILLNNLGVTLTVHGYRMSTFLVIAILAGMALVFGVLLSIRMGRVIR